MSTSNIFIFHGTEGYPEENWFPWLKRELESKGYNVIVPQFPSPPVVPAKISEWFDVLKDYKKYIDESTVFVGHSLGGIFTLRVLEKLEHPVKAAVFVGAPIGVRPILNYDRDNSFSGFDFDWEAIKSKSKNFVVYQSDDDPYVGLDNGKELAKHLGVELSFIPNAGHFNTKAGYTKFEDLRDKLLKVLEES
jgi:predicted alpha/beta hydrolase family esterase